MDNTALPRRRNAADIKVDTLRELVRLGLTMLVPQGKHLDPITANDDLDTAAAVIYGRDGYCRLCAELGHRAGTLALLVGAGATADCRDLASGLTAAMCALGSLPATVNWTMTVNGGSPMSVFLFAIPPKTRLHTQVEVSQGVQMVAEGLIEVAPYRRRDDQDNEYVGTLGALPTQLPLLPPRWRKALAAPRLKAGGKWFAFSSVDEATRLAIAAKALRKAHELLAEILPGGSTVGPEYIARNPHRDDRRPGSFRINMVSGGWADFALPGTRGQDLISLTAYVRSCDYAIAATWLSTRFT